MRARYYDSNLGRFISEDPAYSGTNWSTYCGDNPVNSVDPTGRLDIMALWQVVSQIYNDPNQAGFGWTKKTLQDYLQMRVKMLLNRSKREAAAAGTEKGLGDLRKLAGDEFGATQLQVGMSHDAKSAARDVAEALELRSISDFISEGCPNIDGF